MLAFITATSIFPTLRQPRPSILHACVYLTPLTPLFCPPHDPHRIFATYLVLPSPTLPYISFTFVSLLIDSIAIYLDINGPTPISILNPGRTLESTPHSRLQQTHIIHPASSLAVKPAILTSNLTPTIPNPGLQELDDIFISIFILPPKASIPPVVPLHLHPTWQSIKRR